MTYNGIKEIARKLRRKQTPAETVFWNEFRNRKFNGIKFNRQFPLIYDKASNNELFFYVADFFCFEHKLVIELDGPIHELQKEKDYNRDEVIKSLNLKVLRFKNDELNNMEKVKMRIMRIINPPLPPLEMEGFAPNKLQC
jgi:very-short-patch-repair endonuclease